MTALFNVTVIENGKKITHLELNKTQMDRMENIVAVEPLKYTQEDKVAHCKQFGNN